jgi:hypothetical protein
MKKTRPSIASRIDKKKEMTVIEVKEKMKTEESRSFLSSGLLYFTMMKMVAAAMM